ncbi:hypothetical protein [Conexibacter sp. CPCC 206217]|uniref:hypothetical protein n=1 Tax=Conexibacter sp. CPCC 206217 TaxID=3064574 RepID=UPI0027253186|nr:hypothetical protein [Conexibacter sp. CPCC 206217]MDO8209335.1 hypothetical protein [Conexibacter sp. CPCC 206217]
MNRPYDLDLPILAELEQAWCAAAQRAIGPSAAHAPAADRVHAPATVSAPAHSPGIAVRTRGRAAARREAAGRIARRVLVLTGLGCLVAASAVATRSLVDTGGSDPTLRTSATARLASGMIDGQHWLLNGYRRDHQLCHDLIAAGRVATACQPPPSARELQIDGTLAPLTRIVIGYTGDEIDRVAVIEGRRRVIVPTQPLTSAAGARAARLPRELRWFVALLPRGDGAPSHAGAEVVSYDQDGVRLERRRLRP